MKAKNLILMLGLASLTFATNLALANTIQLYEQPNTTAKSTGMLNLATGMVKIYSPKGSEWVKVADPTNGNVGWVKLADLNQPNNRHVTFTEHIIQRGHGPISYNVVQYGPSPMEIDQKEAKRMFEKMRKRQRAMQLSMLRAMHEMAYEMQSFAYGPWSDFGFPMMMPVMIMPPHAHKTLPKHQAALKTGVQTARANQHSLTVAQNKSSSQKVS